MLLDVDKLESRAAKEAGVQSDHVISKVLRSEDVAVERVCRSLPCERKLLILQDAFVYGCATCGHAAYSEPCRQKACVRESVDLQVCSAERERLPLGAMPPILQVLPACPRRDIGSELLKASDEVICECYELVRSRKSIPLCNPDRKGSSRKNGDCGQHGLCPSRGRTPPIKRTARPVDKPKTVGGLHSHVLLLERRA